MVFPGLHKSGLAMKVQEFPTTITLVSRFGSDKVLSAETQRNQERMEDCNVIIKSDQPLLLVAIFWPGQRVAIEANVDI